MPYKDRERQRECWKRHYERNRSRYIQKRKTYNDKIRVYIENVKASSACTDCGKKYPPYVMDFDHTGDDKKFNVSGLYVRGSLRQVKEEIAKCEIVCSNCHRERTHKRNAGSSNGRSPRFERDVNLGSSPSPAARKSKT